MPELPALLAPERQVEEGRIAMSGEDQRFQVQLGDVGAVLAIARTPTWAARLVRGVGGRRGSSGSLRVMAGAGDRWRRCERRGTTRRRPKL